MADVADKKFVVCVNGNLDDGEWFADLEDAVAYFRDRELGSRGMLLRMLPSPCILNSGSDAGKTKKPRKPSGK